ncbi:hypothetical protein AB0D12_23735 [Streptomyces sp. NPDC048479]
MPHVRGLASVLPRPVLRQGEGVLEAGEHLGVYQHGGGAARNR